MVCKEDVITWFKEAASHRRIDVMCSLLNMCIPFELRYLGTCIEEQGKHDYQELRGVALTANSVEKLAKEFANSKGLFDKCARHRLTVFVSLLQSRNYNCANWMYNTLLRTESLETYLTSTNFNKDVNLHTELLLLFTLTINHPAFTFEQKQYFGNIVTRLTDTEVSVPPTHTLPPYPPGLGYNIKPQLPVHHMTVGVAKTPHTEAPMPPPGIPLPAVHGEFVPPQGMWSRTPFINTSCPPPPPLDLTTFPPPISPLVSQQSSPTPSRSVSPTRMYPCRPHPPIVQHLERLPPPPPPVKDPLVLPSPHYNTDLKTVPIEEIHGDGNEKNLSHQWLEPPMVIGGNKLPNGLLPGMPVPSKQCQTMFLPNEMQALSLEADSSHRCASSSSSSSDCQSPPDTPTENTVTPQPHGPGRGHGHGSHSHGGDIGNKPRNSGGGGGGGNVPPPGLAEPAPTLFSNACTVPYTSHYPPPPPPPSTSFHNRFYPQTYRPQYPAFQQNGEISYMFSYVPMMNFSAPPPPPKVTCFNCGLAGHLGNDCKEQTIEEITQKKGYQLDYTSPPPEPPSQPPPPQPPAEKQ